MQMIWIVLIGIVIGVIATAIYKKPFSIYANCADGRNPFEGKTVQFVEDREDPMNGDGVCGHLEETGDARHSQTVYEKYVKRGFDIAISLLVLVILSPFYLIIMVAIVIDDPGPVFFTQRRIGKNKQFFALHKFRSMKMSTPHDVPTHMLENPEQYITRVGGFLRKTSLDELPQVWDIFLGNMSLVGPRPALWNQDVLIAHRDEYGANDVVPGLTGWAQVNGRDELEIPEKAKYDGDYVKNLTFRMDVTCFLMTIANVLRHRGVVEGGTGALAKHIEKRNQEIYEHEELLR